LDNEVAEDFGGHGKSLGRALFRAFSAGEIHVFDTANFTMEGKKLDSYLADVDSDANYEKDTEAIADGYFHESEYRSAPYFDLTIDGITLLNSMF
jgi:basic membrane protein A